MNSYSIQGKENKVLRSGRVMIGRTTVKTAVIAQGERMHWEVLAPWPKLSIFINRCQFFPLTPQFNSTCGNVWEVFPKIKYQVYVAILVHKGKSSLRQDPATRPWIRAGVWCVQSEGQRESASRAVGTVPGVGNWGHLGRHRAEPAGRSQLSCQAFWAGLCSQGTSGPKTTSPVKRNVDASGKWRGLRHLLK